MLPGISDTFLKPTNPRTLSKAKLQKRHHRPPSPRELPFGGVDSRPKSNPREASDGPAKPHLPMAMATAHIFVHAESVFDDEQLGVSYLKTSQDLIESSEDPAFYCTILTQVDPHVDS